MQKRFVLLSLISLIFSINTYSQKNYCFEKSGISYSFNSQLDFFTVVKDFYLSENLSENTNYKDLAFLNMENKKQKTENNNTSSKRRTYTDKRDGKNYKILKIGEQIWMAENLNFTSTDNSWCYNDSIIYCNKYGRLYNWKEAKNACPSGWHLPTEKEWTILVNNLGGEEIAGGKLKSTTGWNAPNTSATDSIGFSALAGGYRFPNGIYHYIGMYGTWWTATEDEVSYAWDRGMTFEKALIYRSYFSKDYGRSVRCLQN